MNPELYRQATPADAVGLVQNYLAAAHRYGFEPEPAAVIGLLRDTGYSLRRLPQRERK